MFIGYKYEVKIIRDGMNKINLSLMREDGSRVEYHFDRSVPDAVMTNFTGESVNIIVDELPKEMSCLLLMCAEPVSLFTETVPKMRHIQIHLETLTEDDDLLSPCGRAKWRRCVRTDVDAVFFAGPCTGGSPWNRLKHAATGTHCTSYQDESHDVLEIMGRICYMLGTLGEDWRYGIDGITTWL